MQLLLRNKAVVTERAVTTADLLGSDADIAISDLSRARTLSRQNNAHACGNSPYEGIKVPDGMWRAISALRC